MQTKYSLAISSLPELKIPQFLGSMFAPDPMNWFGILEWRARVGMWYVALHLTSTRYAMPLEYAGERRLEQGMNCQIWWIPERQVCRTLGTGSHSPSISTPMLFQ